MDKLFLWRGLVLGFAIVDPDCPASYFCDNYDSITGDRFRKEMSDLLHAELLAHKVSRTSSTPTCVHFLGAVTKANGSLRPITDCSRPDGSSINNYMSTTFKPFTYNSVDSAVQLLTQGDYMALVDISSAYRSVNILADHVKYQGLSWDFGEGQELLLDHRLCFGLKSAPNIFDTLSNFIVEITNSLGAGRVVKYLDDFLVIAPTYDECLASREVVTSVIAHLGFEVSWKKVTAPSQICTFLGITIDSIIMELSLPLDLHPIPMYSDSSFLGFGAWMGRDWLFGSWEPEDVPRVFPTGCSHLCDPPVFDKPTRNINVLEFWPVVAGLRRWGPHFKNCYVHVITDNMQVLAMLATGRSVNKMCMTWLREVFWMCFIWNIDISPSYIRSADNVLADALSRLAYRGTPHTCWSTLCDLNMCCSSPPDRSIPEAPKDKTTHSTTCFISRIDQEVEEVPNGLLL